MSARKDRAVSMTLAELRAIRFQVAAAVMATETAASHARKAGELMFAIVKRDLDARPARKRARKAAP